MGEGTNEVRLPKGMEAHVERKAIEGADGVREGETLVLRMGEVGRGYKLRADRQGVEVLDEENGLRVSFGMGSEITHRYSGGRIYLAKDSHVTVKFSDREGDFRVVEVRTADHTLSSKPDQFSVEVVSTDDVDENVLVIMVPFDDEA